MQANKRLRSPSIQSPFVNKRQYPRNHPPILNLDTNIISIESSNEIDTATLLVSQDKTLTFPDPLNNKLPLGIKHSDDLLGKLPISNFSSPGKTIMREQQNNNVSKYLLMFQKNYIKHEVINIILLHTNSHIHHLFPIPQGDNTFSPTPQGVPHATKPSLPQLIASIINTSLPKIQPPYFQFNISEEAAITNFEIITNAKGLQQAILEQRNSPISLGSEFRPPHLLEPLLSWHPFWPKLRSILEKGVNYKLQPIKELERQQDFQAALEYGHHKSAKRNFKVFMNSLKSEVKLGYALPLLAKHAITIPQAELAPHGLTSQHTINDRGEILSKDRINHDLSFPGKASFNSINNRIEDDSLVPCLFKKKQ